MARPQLEDGHTKIANELLEAIILTHFELQRACHEDFGMQPVALMAELNIKNWSELKLSPADAYCQVAATRKVES
jgi:hypothetical protein